MTRRGLTCPALVLCAIALAPLPVAAAEPARVAWPDGCVDRVEDGVVVVLTDSDVELEVRTGGAIPPPEGACFRGGVRSRADEVVASERAQALIRALETIGTERIFSLTSDGPCP
jgi:hypothetical protein